MSRPTGTCAICGCAVHHDGDYAKPTAKGRSHATKHHCVAERFFGRSANRPGPERAAILPEDPWHTRGLTITFCYECHEVLIHNPVLLENDVERFAQFCRNRGLSEHRKSISRTEIAGRIALFHEVIARGLRELDAREAGPATSPPDT